MRRIATSDGLRRGSALLGVALSATTLLVAAAIWTVPTLTPVGTAAAVVISAMTLSLPVVAVGLLYSLRSGVSGVELRAERLLWRSSLGALALFMTGTVAVVSGVEPIRTVGDWLYAIGIVVLFVVSTATLFVEGK
jgi:O-antigen ligase